jgi:putative ABC transport system permease protein
VTPSAPVRPPVLAEQLVRLSAPAPDWRDVSLGDLHEEFQAIAARQGAHAARRWYWRQAAAALAEMLRRRSRYTTGAIADAVRPKGDRMFAAFRQEARLALRAIVHQPLVGAIVIVTLALGLGANIATFGMIDALMLRPFTIPEVDRLVMPSENSTDDPYPEETIAPAGTLAYGQPWQSLSGAASYGWWDVNLSGGSEPERVLGFRVSGDFFSLLGVTPARGRLLDPSDMTFGRHRQVVMADGLWKRRFNADPGVVGRTIQLDGEPYEVVGVAPAAFTFPDGADVWAPLALNADDAADRKTRRYTTFARLKPDVPFERAASEMEARFNALKTEHPADYEGRRVVVRTFSEGMIDIGMPNILMLWQAAAFLVLLIGCTNVANLLLARGAARQRELAVRLAIGASRWRIVRQLLVEGLMLSLVATPAAIAVAALMFGVLKAAMPPVLVRFLPGWDRMAVNGGLVVYAVAAAMLAAVLFSLLPALQASRPNVTAALRDGGRSVAGAAARSRLRRGLVVAEIALALPLLVASGLSAVGAQRFASGPQGYDPSGVVRARTILPEATYPTPESRRIFAERVVEEARRIPGVERAATASELPASGGNQQRSVTLEGRPPDPAHPITVNYRAVSPDFLALLRIPLQQGRGITPADRDGTEPVIVLSESAARRFWPGESALGRRVRLGSDDTKPWLTVVGIAGNTIHNWYEARNEITAYVPVAQAPSTVVNLVVRASVAPETLADSVRRAITTVDPTQPAFEVMTMAEALRIRTTGIRFISGLMAAFGILALVLATVGIYSVMAFYVAQRRYEVGIRMALGATARDILGLTVGHGARIAGLGIVIGLAFGVALARVMENLLFGIVAVEPWLFVAIALTLALAAIGASLLPARLATKVDPAVALRT